MCACSWFWGVYCLLVFVDVLVVVGWLVIVVCDVVVGCLSCNV